jgi:prepilin-type N-terminal cleavage/methylation domain-containing protein
MATPSNNPGSGTGCGVTLIELVVSMSIAGIVFASVMFSWTYISRHTTIQQRKSIFAAQAEQAASLIANDIRKSPGVVFVEPHAIAYLSPIGDDTTRYYFDNDSLRKNNAAVQLVVPCAKIVQFTIEKQDSTMASAPSDAAQDRQRDIILLVTLGMHDCFDNNSVVRLVVRVKQLANGALLSGSRTWNW